MRNTFGLYLGNSDANSHHFVYNNVFYNNYDETTLSVKNIYIDSSTGVGAFSNNYTNGGVIDARGEIVNGDNTPYTNSPNFKKPTSLIGNTTDLSFETSYWSINTGSYLIGKGAAVAGLSRDKDNNFYASPRAVGAYEYINKTITGVDNKENNRISIFVKANSEIVILTDENMSYSVFNIFGQKQTGGITSGDCTIIKGLNKGSVFIIKIKGFTKKVLL